MPGAEHAKIHVERLSHSYARDGETVTALEDIHLSVAPGELVSIVGPSGCGKTTLLDRKSTRLNSSHIQKSRMPSSA